MELEKKESFVQLDALKDKIEKLERAVSYYKNLSDEVAGYNIMVDSQIIFLKRDLEQKKIGYEILHKLHETIGTKIDLDTFFASTLKLILTTMKMDKAVVLWRNSTFHDSFVPKWHLGYNKTDLEAYLQNELDLTELNDLIEPSILVNKSTQKEPYIEQLSRDLLLPFMVGTPILSGDKIEGWVIAGREKEALPFYPPLMPSDLETFEVIGGFMKANVSNYQLLSNLSRANKRLENYNQELTSKVEERTHEIEISRKELEKEKIKSDGLLLNILPAKVAEELKQKGSAEARSLENVTIMFTDFVNFTQYAQTMKPAELVSELHECFTAFDEIITNYGIEKIKTIGDGYMAAGGMHSGVENAAGSVVRAALEMQQFINHRTAIKGNSFSMRLGIHSGPVVAGIVGVRKFQYDIWGDTVNTASRMESSGENGKVNISHSTYSQIKNIPDFAFEPRGKVAVKGKKDMEMWFVSYR